MPLTNSEIESIIAGMRPVLEAVNAKPAEKWAAERKAFAEGKVIQFNIPHVWGDKTWEDFHGDHSPGFHRDDLKWRIKPWTLPAPPSGQQWHRTDWTQDMLPDGWRPLLRGEMPDAGDEVKGEPVEKGAIWTRFYEGRPRKVGICENGFFYRSQRPLPDLERERFEKWWSGERGMSISRYTDGEFSHCYAHPDTRTAWEAWTAARKSQP